MATKGGGYNRRERRRDVYEERVCGNNFAREKSRKTERRQTHKPLARQLVKKEKATKKRKISGHHAK